MRIIFCAVIILLFSLPHKSVAQGYMKSDYLFSSTFKEKDEDSKLGSGDLLKISGRYTMPLSAKQNSLGQTTAWFSTLGGSYSTLNNVGIAKSMNPNEVLNINLNISHVRPLSEKWSLIATLGGGIYSEPNKVTWKSLLVNGGAIFIYRLNDKLDVGLGAGITNSYGVPVIMPMAYLKLNMTGRYEIKVDLSTKIEIAATAKFSNKFHLKLIAMEMDGISAVMEKDGKSMIYSSTMMRSYLTPEFIIAKSFTVFLGGGAVWTRSSKLSERTLKSFWNSFKNDDEKYRFKPTGYLTVGFRYGF